MLPLIAALALAQSPIADDPPRLRTVLDNDAVILVERMPKEPLVSVQLFASSRYVPETEPTHGFRHLLEHLLVRGPDGSVDRQLEAEACFLQARTLRDAMQIELTVGPNQLELALGTLRKILTRPRFTQEQLDHELRVMRDEIAMQDDAIVLASSAWKTAYGAAGLDPLGTFDSMYRATPEKLAETFDAQFAANGLALVIAGPVDLDKTTTLAKALLQPRPKRQSPAPMLAREGKHGRAEAPGFGECRAALVPGFNSPKTAAALMAALAISSEFSTAFMIYTPTVRNGLVLVGRTDSNSGIGLYIDSVTGGGGLYQRGRYLAKEWLASQLRTASGVAYFRGLLLCQSSSLRPETFESQIDAVTPRQFEDAILAFDAENGVIAVGTR